MAPAAERNVVAGLHVTWQEFGVDSVDPTSGRRAADADPVAGPTSAGFGIWVPDDPDGLLDGMTQEEFERTDERMPYFSAVWPSAESLVAMILAGPSLDGRQTLDLGCGLGPCGFAAACRGARVTFFDWEPRALELVAASARNNGWSDDAFDLVVGDWRRPPRFGPFDLIVGADVLYEHRNGPTVAAFIASRVRPGGEAWIADPGRPQAALFPTLAREAGLELVGADLLPPAPHGFDIRLFRLEPPRA